MSTRRTPNRASVLTAAGLLPFFLPVAGCSEPARRPEARADPEAAFRERMGQQWELARLGSRGVPPPPPGTPPDSLGRDLVPGRRPTIRFTPGPPPSAGGRSFCNGYGGPFVLRGDSLRITEVESTAVGCDGPDSLETRFFRAVWGTRRFELDSAALVLIAADGTRLTFVPADGAPPPPAARRP